MWFIEALLLAFYLSLVMGLNCTNQCCYYYHGVPKNVTMMPCNLQGSTITWECQVYSPHDLYTNLSVKWYRSATDVSTREEGNLIQERNGGRHTFSAFHASSAVNDSLRVVHGLFLDVFRLTVNNFDASTDDGYYRCQIVVNNSCLQPSNVGSIASNSHLTRDCNFSPLDFIEYKIPQECATKSSCIREAMTTKEMPLIISTSSQGQNIDSVTSATSVTNDMSESRAKTTVELYAVIGALLFVTILLLLVILAFTYYTVRNHLVKGKNDHGIDLTDPSCQSLKLYDRFTQTEFGIKSTDITHGLEANGAVSLQNAQPLNLGIPPPNSSPPKPPVSPTDNPPLPAVCYNPIGFSRLSSKDDEEVNYAYPVQRQLLKSHMTLTSKSSPSLTGQYQEIRFSRLDYVPMYNATKRTSTEAKNYKPSYVNIAN